MAATAEFLVTGATGLLGNNIVRRLSDEGRSVRALVRSAARPPALADLEVELHRGDLTDASSLRSAARGVKCVVHAAGDLHIGWRHLERQRRTNVVGTAHVAQAAREAGARMVHVSTVDTLAASRDGHPVDEQAGLSSKVACTYVVTKREAEETVLSEVARGLDAVIVNPGFMLGPWDWKPSSGRMLLSVAARWTPAAPWGGMSGCDVREVARGTLAAAEHGRCGERYILAGENISFLEAWRLFARIAGQRGPLFRAGPLVRLVAGYGGDLWGMATGQEPDVNSAMVKMSGLRHYYDSSRAQRELGYRIAPFEVAVRDAWNWFQQHGYV